MIFNIDIWIFGLWRVCIVEWRVGMGRRWCWAHWYVEVSAASGDGCNVVGQCTTVYTHVPAEGIWAASICALGTSLCLRTCLLLLPDCHRGSHKTFFAGKSMSSFLPHLFGVGQAWTEVVTSCYRSHLWAATMLRGHRWWQQSLFYNDFPLFKNYLNFCRWILFSSASCF